jgi:hypothetical protein
MNQHYGHYSTAKGKDANGAMQGRHMNRDAGRFVVGLPLATWGQKKRPPSLVGPGAILTKARTPIRESTSSCG